MKMALTFFGLTLPLLCGFAAEETILKNPNIKKGKTLTTMVARYSPAPVNMDGRLSDPAWQKAEVYEMYLADDRANAGEVLQEPGEVRLLWDDDYLYIGVKFVDSDIVADGTEDQVAHYQFGDVCEVFLKPQDHSWYWELFATPLGKRTTLLWPEKNFSLMKEAYAYRADMKVAAWCNGSLNKTQDSDGYWSAEIAMPVEALTARGEKFEPGAQWRILISRYNYNHDSERKSPELSMTPPLSKTNYHLLDEYAVLKIEK